MNNIVTPNAKISRNTMTAIIVTEVVIFLSVWCVSPFVFLPKPGQIFTAAIGLWGNGILNDLITSFILNLEALLLSTFLSLILVYFGTIPVFRPIVAAAGKLRFLSMVGLTFFFTLLTRSGHGLKLSMLVFSVSVFFVTGMADVVSSIPREQFDLARTLRMGPWRTLYEVVIRGQADRVFDVLRQNAAIGWMMLSFVESMSRSEGGIGAVLTTEDKYFHLPAVAAIQLLVLGLGLGQDYSFGWFKAICCPYADLSMENSRQ